VTLWSHNVVCLSGQDRVPELWEVHAKGEEQERDQGVTAPKVPGGVGQDASKSSSFPDSLVPVEGVRGEREGHVCPLPYQGKLKLEVEETPGYPPSSCPALSSDVGNSSCSRSPCPKGRALGWLSNPTRLTSWAVQPWVTTYFL
jgi:hypothetical protein